jgi:predicted nicotinamide N-methyase
MNWTQRQRQTFILANTEVTSPFLCPELKLHLITPSCSLWSATEKDLVELAIPDPFWGFCWAGGQALARYLLDHAELVAGKRVFVFGAGCGIEAIAAVMAGAARVQAADIDPLAVEATQLNAALNGVSLEATTRDMIGASLSGYDLLLAGDMFYDAAFAARILHWLRALAQTGMTILLADPGRGHIDQTLAIELTTYQAPADVDVGGDHLQATTIFALA